MDGVMIVETGAGILKEIIEIEEMKDFLQRFAMTGVGIAGEVAILTAVVGDHYLLRAGVDLPVIAREIYESRQYQI